MLPGQAWVPNQKRVFVSELLLIKQVSIPQNSILCVKRLIESGPDSTSVAGDIEIGELLRAVVKHMLDEVEMVSLSKNFVLEY
jgi:hypothetical protein